MSRGWKVAFFLILVYSAGLTLAVVLTVFFFANETKIQARMAKDSLDAPLVFEDDVPEDERKALRSGLDEMIRMMEREDNDEVRITFMFPLVTLPDFYYKDRRFSREETAILLESIGLGKRAYKLRRRPTAEAAQ